MFDTIQEIAENKILCNLVELADNFNMYGAYIKYTKAKNPYYNRIYFVCSTSAKEVTDKNLNIEEIYKQQLNSQVFNLKIHITAITNQSPYNVHSDIINYCLHASTVNGLLNLYGYENNFECISTGFILLLEMLYLNSINKNLKSLEQEKQFAVGQEFLKRMGKIELELNGKDSDSPKIHLAPEKLDKNCPNMVSMEELIHQTLSIEKITVTPELLPKVKAQLNNHPEILYYQAKPVVSKLKMPDHLGFGSKEANTFSTIKILYDTTYSKEMDLIYLRAKFPQAFRLSMNEIKAKSKTNTVCYVGISIADFEQVFKNAAERNIPICLDTDRLYYNCDPNAYPEKNVAGYALAIPNDEKYIWEMDNMLTAMAYRDRQVRILSKEDVKNHSYFRG